SKPSWVAAMQHRNRAYAASLPTRLSDFGATHSKQLINWGYAICDRASALTTLRLSRKGCPRPSGLIQTQHSPEAPVAVRVALAAQALSANRQSQKLRMVDDPEFATR